MREGGREKRSTLFFEEVWHLKSRKVGNERLRVVGGRAWIHSNCSQTKPHPLCPGNVLVLSEGVEEGERVLASRETDQHSVTILDHVVLLDGLGGGGGGHLYSSSPTGKVSMDTSMVSLRMFFGGWWNLGFHSSPPSLTGMG